MYSHKSKSSKIEENLEDYIQQAKVFKIQKYFKDGLYLDVKDDITWCVAQIVYIDRETSRLHVHFDNWSDKYNEDLSPNDRKILPLRFSSIGYTGQKKSTLREYDSGLTKKEKMLEGMEAYSKNKFN